MNKIIFQTCEILLNVICLCSIISLYLVQKQGFSFENMKKKLVPYQLGVISKIFFTHKWGVRSYTKNTFHGIIARNGEYENTSIFK